MSSRRVLKAAQAIREVVSMAIISDLKDPRIGDVTVTLVEVTPDMRQAKVNVSVMGDETKQNLCIRGLQSSAGYLQQKVGKRIDTRYTPRLQFVLDKGIKHSMLVTRILEDVIPMERGTSQEPGIPDGETSPDEAVEQGEMAPETDSQADGVAEDVVAEDCVADVVENAKAKIVNVNEVGSHDSDADVATDHQQDPT